jgi:hypothetical protein
VRWDGNERVFPIDQIAAGPLLAAPGIDVLVRLALKRGQSGDRPVAGEMRRNLQKRFMREIARVYAVALPVAAAGSTLGILLAMILWRFAPPPAGVVPLAFACAIAVGTRIALLTYIDVSSFPAVNALYVSSASPILLVFVVLGLYLGIRAGVACLTATRRQPS